MNRLAIKHALLDKGMTLVVLARTAGLSYDRVVRVVNGYRRPRQEEVRAIADALGMKACELSADLPTDPDGSGSEMLTTVVNFSPKEPETREPERQTPGESE